jgi:murein DD-endopeptidase MepM/ murein hydrolase activator NlpD
LTTRWSWTIVLDHGDGAQSRYSHNSANLVRVGDVVAGGQATARVGSTGHATGPHLDDRVTIAGRPVNPSSLR